MTKPEMICNKNETQSWGAGDKNSTRPLVITSEIWEGGVTLPKALVL